VKKLLFVLLAFTLFPINGLPLLITVANQWWGIVSLIPSQSFWMGYLISIFSWNMLLFMLWITILGPIYWSRVYTNLRDLHIVKNLKTAKKPVSVIIAAYNEERTILKTIEACNAQTWKPRKIIIVDDGSKDRTSHVIITRYKLRETNRNVFEGSNIILIRKKNAGKDMALDTGLSYVDTAFFCIFDADTIPDRDGIELLVSPMVRDRNVHITSGRNQFIGGFTNPLMFSQTVEFFNDSAIKAFRNSLNAQTVLIGNFSAYRTNKVFELKGFSNRGLTEDFDYNYEVHETRGYGKSVKIVSVLTARGWTAAPHSLSGFMAQRSRWSAGILFSLKRRSHSLFNSSIGYFSMMMIPLQWYKIITFPIFFIVNYIVLPILFTTWIINPTIHTLLFSVFVFYFLPSYVYEYILEPSIMACLDWYFIGSYENKRTYIGLIIWKMCFGYLYEAVKAYCTFFGYVRAILGTTKWGKSERITV